MSETQSLKYIVLNYFHLPQSVLQDTFQNFPRKRDYYQVPNRTFSSFGPIFNSFKVIADTVNLSLITDNYFKSVNISKEKYTDIYPAVWSFPGAPYSLKNVVNTYSNGSKNIDNDVKVITVPTIGFNFIYCDVPKVKTELPWNFETLTFSFEFDIWCLILLSIVCVILTIKQIVRKSSLSDTIFLVLGSLFPDVLHVPKLFKQIPLLYIWVFSCFVISIHYSATITSILISPPQEDSLSFFSEVVQNNFTILFDSIVAFRVINASVRHQLPGSKNPDILAINSIMDLLTSKTRVLNNEVHTGVRESPAKRLATERKLALVHLWNFVIPVVKDVDNLYENIEPYKRPVHCYIGKRLIPCGSMYQISVLPQGNKKLGRISSYMMESGINNYWRDEYIALKFAARIQDRSKVISKTKIIYSFEKAVTTPLELEGKISSVFFLWVICLMGGCCTVFAGELWFLRVK